MNLFVGNLNPDTTDAQLIKMFSEFGEVLTAKIVKDNITGDSRGFGFVEMADKFHSYDAIDNLDCTFLQGNIISVKEAKARTNDKPAPRKRTFVPRGNSTRTFTPRTENSRSENTRGDYPRNDRPGGDRPRPDRFTKRF